MNFDLSPDQKLLVDTVASFVRKESPVTRMRALRKDPMGYTREMWKQMGELGWLGIVFPESAGGLGGSFVDIALILEQLGTTLVPEPIVPSVVLAGGAIMRAGSDEQKTRWLEPLIAGDTTLALAHAERDSRFNVARVGLRAERDGEGYRLRGEKVFVLNGHAADALVVSARVSGEVADRDGLALFVVDRDMPGLHVTPVQTMDGRRAANVRFESAAVPADRRLDGDAAAASVLDEVMDLGAAAACAEGVGVMRTALQMTVDYLRTREQFGVKIGTFQALQHRAVDMFVETELCKSMSILAAIKAGDPDETERKAAISAAKVQLAVGGRFVTQQAIQLHGGIGVTDEHDIGLYFKRMHILNTLFGDEEFHLSRFASLPSFTRGTELAQTS
jgi:alkylation response protein AidB-like acyl-CoA dehydrogenase